MTLTYTTGSAVAGAAADANDVSVLFFLMLFIY
jgi:hypothetical protein